MPEVEPGLLIAGCPMTPWERSMIGTLRPRHLALAALAPLPLLAALGLGMTTSALSETSSNTSVVCLDRNENCKVRVIRLPDGVPGQVLKFEFCQEGDCDRAHREHWRTHYLVPPEGEVCRNTNITEALNWIEQNSKGWLLAGWGCVSGKQVRLPV
jgi:hypothetical protein